MCIYEINKYNIYNTIIIHYMNCQVLVGHILLVVCTIFFTITASQRYNLEHCFKFLTLDLKELKCNILISYGDHYTEWILRTSGCYLRGDVTYARDR